MSSPPDHHRFGDGSATDITGFVFTTIDLQIMLIAAAGTVAVAIIPQGGAAITDTLLNHLVDSPVQFDHLLRGKAGGAAFRVNTCQSQALIDINIPQTANKFLI